MTLSELRQRCATGVALWHRFMQMPYTVVFGLVGGVVVSYYAQPYEWYDGLFPVVRMEVDVVGRDANSITLHLVGDKKRSCEPKHIDAFGRVGNMLHDINIARQDVQDTLTAKPLGRHDFGIWRVWPSGGERVVLVYILYDCDGRIVPTKVAEVAL